ncbi:22717_t:CDS:2, partial [Gigaspora rosea]
DIAGQQTTNKGSLLNPIEFATAINMDNAVISKVPSDNLKRDRSPPSVYTEIDSNYVDITTHYNEVLSDNDNTIYDDDLPKDSNSFDNIQIIDPIVTISNGNNPEVRNNTNHIEISDLYQ